MKQKQFIQLLIIASLTLAFIVLFNYFLQKMIGKMKYPVQGKITSPYGMRTHPISGVEKFHNGIDIAAPIGTDIFAPASGTVTKKYSDSLGGKSLVIKHDNGFSTGYAHLSGWNVEIGDRVKTGQIIAQTGNTGASTGPHLHLTMRDQNGEYVNPVDYLA
jgi:murein DD-endopeptidase MepM/ murein hydrolase activator NlpD